jgi:DNA-3-methyladenine glycosylase
MDMDWIELERPAWEVAPRLLGCLLVRELNGHRLVGRIVETEAYDQTDAASHSYRGRTPRTDVMFGPAGHLYVYFTYGMHYCMNVVCGPERQGAAVLIRAIEPLEGGEWMLQNRAAKLDKNGQPSKMSTISTARTLSGVALTNGPAKTCQAFGIDRPWNGHDLRATPFQLQLQPPLPANQIVQTTRIGIRQAADVPWRFYIRGNPYVSRTG